MVVRILSFVIVLLACAGAQGQLALTENKGQWPDQVRFRGELGAGQFWVENNGFKLQLVDPEVLKSLHRGGANSAQPDLYKEHRLYTRFVNGNAQSFHGEKPYSHPTHFYLGEKRVSNAQTFQSVNGENTWPGIDVHYYQKGNHLKYDFIVHPNGNAASIAMELDGAENLSLRKGDLVIPTSVGDLIQKAPYSYQIIQGKFKEVRCEYVLHNGVVSLDLGNYDHDYDLIIDPELIFASYSGSSGNNFGFTACYDSEGNLISGSVVFNTGYPISAGAFQSNFNSAASGVTTTDCAISKFSADGTQLLFSTYLGGSAMETPHSIIVDSNDNIIVMGVTGSSNFPTSPGCFQNNHTAGSPLIMTNFFVGGHNNGCDFFVTKFNSNGNFLASTYLGLESQDGLNYANQLFYNYGDAFRGEVNVDANDNIYVASVTRGPFPETTTPQDDFGGGTSDGVVFEFNPDLSDLIWSTFIGGSDDDACYSVQFADDGTILVCGGTKSADFPHAVGGNDNTFGGEVDGFILRIDPVSRLILSGTFVGTNEYDQCYFLQTDLAGNIYVLGQTEGVMPVTAGCYGVANSGQFIRKYSSNLLGLLWSTVIGTGSGEVDISPTAFLVNDCDHIYFAGWGGQTNIVAVQAYNGYAEFSTTIGLPITGNAFQANTDGSDFYLCLLNPDAASLLYATFFGGSESAEHVDGGTSRFNKNGSVYHAVCAGCQNNDDFPTTPNAWSNTNNSSGCNLGVFKFDLAHINATLSVGGPPIICEDVSTLFENNSQGANQFQWTFGDGATSTLEEPSHTYANPGTYNVQLIAIDESECLQSDTMNLTVEVLPGVNPTVVQPGLLCYGDNVTLQATGSPALYWLTDATLSDTTIPNPIANPTEDNTYYVVDVNDCDADTLPVFVDVYLPTVTAIEDQSICVGQSATLQVSALNSVAFEWTPNATVANPNAGLTSANPTETTIYYVEVTTSEGCTNVDSMTVFVSSDFPGGNVYPQDTICFGSSAQLLAEEGTSWLWSPSETLSDATIQNPLASPLLTTTYDVFIENGCGSGTSSVTVVVVTPEAIASGGGLICQGQYIPAFASGLNTYTWAPSSVAFPAYGDTVQLSPSASMYVIVSGLDQNGCYDEDSVFVEVLPAPLANAGADLYFDFPGQVQLNGEAFGNAFFWSPAEYLSCTDCEDPISNSPNIIYYTLTVTDELGCQSSDSVMVKPYFPIWVPNTITPNNDGINDVFFAVGNRLDGYELNIFDRWGNRIFHSIDPTEVWDGGLSGYYVQNDAYIWTIEYDTIDRREKLIGHVNVIR